LLLLAGQGVEEGDVGRYHVSLRREVLPPEVIEDLKGVLIHL
jgi:hypothetical protein